jgi:hypothetical protein
VSQTSLADEVWNSTYGKVVYEADIGSTALWSYNNQGTLGLIYINDLAGVYTDRGSYKGYWIQESSEVKCKTQRMMKDKPTFYWGKVHIRFLDPSFPSRWQAKWSYCDKVPREDWQGIPIAGN